MDEKTRALIGQLKGRLIGVSDDQISEIITEAREEALAEAKALIKEMMVQAILEQALVDLTPHPSPTRRGKEGEVAQTGTTESEEQIRREIEAIRGKIAENERLLSRVKASPIEAEGESANERMGETGFADSQIRRFADYGYYVYGIVGSDSNQPVEGLPEEGIDPAHPVYALQSSATSAIVSRVSLQEFGQEELEAHLNDIQWVEAKVRAHQRVLEAVLASHTLVPMRFCTIYRSESRVQEMLAQHYDDFVETLARLKGRQEWGVKVYCDSETLAQRVRETSDRVKELQAEMEQKSSGAAYFLKKKLEEAVAEEVERVSDEYAQRSHDCLSSQAEEAVINPLQSKELTGRKETMVLNGAYLVAEGQLTAFRAELESLTEEYSDLGLIYEMTGPWPPYSFVSMGFEESAADE